MLVLLVKSETLETGVEKSWRIPRAKLLVLLVKSETLETGVEKSWRNPREYKKTVERPATFWSWDASPLKLDATAWSVLMLWKRDVPATSSMAAGDAVPIPTLLR